ncbi:MAG TPA: peptidoglycan-binding protein [Parvibaculum sp.]|uniref:peptidoglycan-binding protein n=1 Tax=Parvibaculum sp. TaxID=2024848 RepID=UPI002BC40C4D|nr:peptidoglycan-binding protein [Parvibaculum sp.]HMM13940.1 peptidoglycan-binding protein [Parvibaculum sp.]
MLSELQKQAAQAIVNIFETGRAQGDHARLTLAPGDPGHLTYGRSQTTLASGNLYLLIKSYCEMAEAAYGRALKPYLPRLAALDLTLDHDRTFHALLRQAGSDPAMRVAQDSFFDRAFWEPATRAVSALGFATALGTAIVYDGFVHGSWSAMRDRTAARHGGPAALGERKWVEAYVSERRNWLAKHSNGLLQRTVYRMDAFGTLIAAENWPLDLPFTVCGVAVDRAALSGGAAARNLRLTHPPMTGEDVCALRQALAREGFTADQDGVFDEGLDRMLRAFQMDRGIAADGIAGPATRGHLGL